MSLIDGLLFLIILGAISAALLIAAILYAIGRMLVRAFFDNLEEPDTAPSHRMRHGFAAGHPSTI